MAFLNDRRGASSHFFCDDSSIYQSVALKDKAWHCGCSTGYKTACRNTNSFGIEMCTSGNYLVSEKTQINAAYLCAHLCKLIGITANTVDTYVLRHYDVVATNKKCPAQYVSDTSQWTQFKTWVKNILNTGSHEGIVISVTPTTSSNLKIDSNVKAIQSWLNTHYNSGLVVDGSFGTKSKKALIKAWQTEAGNLDADGSFGAKSKERAKLINIKKGDSGIFVTIWQAYLVCRGYNPNGIDGKFGNGSHSVTVAFQKNNGLGADGIVGSNTWYKAFN